MQNIDYKEAYLPVDQDFEIILTSLINEGKSGKIHFFNANNQVDDVAGLLTSLEKSGIERWLGVDGTSIRMDKIITVLGKPGPCYDHYISFANACLTCEDLGQF
ncbi:MAG: hypothetical protein ACI9A7_000589 [Cyclobacteriaceae bacterium]|jgi:hypothetical protein